MPDPEPAKTAAATATPDKPKPEATPPAPTGEEVADKIFPESKTEPKKEEPKPPEPEAAKKEEPKQEPEKPKADDKKPDEKRYDLKVPEDSPLGEGAAERIAAYARERGLSNEQAQELLTREHAAVQGYADAQQTAADKEVESWKEAVKTDPEIGGEKFVENLGLANRFIDRFGSKELKRDLNDTGLGNHPEFIRLCVHAAQSMSEQSLVIPSGQPAAKRTAEDVFYGGGEAK